MFIKYRFGHPVISIDIGTRILMKVLAYYLQEKAFGYLLFCKYLLNSYYEGQKLPGFRYCCKTYNTRVNLSECL